MNDLFLDTPATKRDLKDVISRLDALFTPVTDNSPANPNMADLLKRLLVIEKISKESVGMGLKDIPVDAETVSAITGLAVTTVEKYGSYKHIKTIKIGRKRQFSLKDCYRLVNDGVREAIIDCTTDMTTYRRKKRRTAN